MANDDQQRANERPSGQEPPERPYDEDVSAFVERFAADMTEAGMPRMPSRVFACLLAEDSGVLGSSEIAERLQISPAAVSGAVRYLSQVRMISRERVPGSRREQYRLHADVWYEAIVNRDDVLARWLTTFRTGVDVLGARTPAGERMGETVEFFEFMRAELDGMVERWRAHRAARSRT
ncbi:MarR family transcriptional regulator [Streptomyces sp. HNM0574]|uniref:GbsR/MarR family transcriptional regulator n=1 Tax=Streptomyces sp. HNM0574 TaxID=2714954 RepID=UPI00146D0666|nr:MarR family transcriptional regulator [Streptomyces sp. HNM0574]NLU68524.1 MarR family transcriptional regulator [Streptomyces sp. HNM0574]